MFPPKPAPEKYCEQCGELMDRKRFNGRIEDMAVFMRRRYCDLTCSGLASRKVRAPANEKYCGGCKATRPAEDFGVLTSASDGRRYRCRLCESASTRRWQLKNQTAVQTYRQEYTRANRDRLKARRRQAYHADPARDLAKQRLWRERNPGAASAASRAWALANPEKYAANMRQRRARVLGADGTATAEQIAARVAFYGWSCWMCGGPYEHLDHVIPLARGGTNWPANLRPACKPCNLKKGARRHDAALPSAGGSGDHDA